MTTKVSETETVVKRILPYLVRRGYDIEKDLHFEILSKSQDRYEAGFVDILVWVDKLTSKKATPDFIIEAKRIAKPLSDKDRKQALSYAADEKLHVPFVVIANGSDIRCFNATTGEPLKWNGKLSAKLPTKAQLRSVSAQFKKDSKLIDVELKGEDGRPAGVSSLPYRPGLPLRQLNALFSRCHDAIRKHEKDENHVFDDFSKLLFLKLLEEKADTDSVFSLPYSWLFHELAAYPDTRADQVESAVKDMIEKIKKRTTYGEVLADPLNLKNSKTFLYIVRQLAAISFNDSAMDSKGAAFEYFVRATLKGKKLGQYFTPRPLVDLMATLIGKERIVNGLLTGQSIRILDPACGTGGFLVFLMGNCLRLATDKLTNKEITKATYDSLVRKIRQEIFFGSDANEGVACAAKMNMIVAGDGHSNIKPENSLAAAAENWRVTSPDCDFILTNPPFGTSESGTLTEADLLQFDHKTPKGQWLFLQKMVSCTKDGGEICTVIDEGVLNTDSATDVRRWIMERCKVLAVIHLPDETFKPNKITVRSSVLYLQKRTAEEIMLGSDISHVISFVDLKTLGTDSSGDPIRGFDFQALQNDARFNWISQDLAVRNGNGWAAFGVETSSVCDPSANSKMRLDVKFWSADTRATISRLAGHGKSISDLNLIKTARGNSPSPDDYVDQKDGYALVVKAGSNINKFGELVVGGDFIEKALYDEFVAKAVKLKKNLNLLKDGDVLVSSTGDGTLGKCCVFRPTSIPEDIRPAAAIAEGHVSIIRVDPKTILPEYLCDYLRAGFGAKQIERLYTGSTGMIELTPDALDAVFVSLPPLKDQKRISDELRAAEKKSRSGSLAAEEHLRSALRLFQTSTAV